MAAECLHGGWKHDGLPIGGCESLSQGASVSVGRRPRRGCLLAKLPTAALTIWSHGRARDSILDRHWFWSCRICSAVCLRRKPSLRFTVIEGPSRGAAASWQSRPEGLCSG